MGLESSAEFEKELHAIFERCRALNLSRPTQASEIICFGGELIAVLKQVVELHVNAHGNTLANRQQAISLTFQMFESELAISRPSARGYIRCFQKFAENRDAPQVFKFAEINALASRNATATQIDAMLLAKRESKRMTFAEFAAHLEALQKMGSISRGGEATDKKLAGGGQKRRPT